MKILLAAVNAKYIHSNLGIYSLKAFAQQELPAGMAGRVKLELGEYTINHQPSAILKDIYRRKPDVIGFSCYIWNIDIIRSLAEDVKKVLPCAEIWLGGPEVSYNAAAALHALPFVKGVMKGEGEETFAQLVQFYVDKESCLPESCGKPSENSRLHLEDIPGLLFRREDNRLSDTGVRPLMDLSRIPFSYKSIGLKELEHRIIYYESSRGCPFSCSYCLSSIDKSVRFRDLDLVKEELAWFLSAGVLQVKFVDRTFNCRRSHALAIWQFIKENDNGITNFHFEIAADLLGEEELSLLAGMRPGLVQLEIGVQTTNPHTLKAIRRQTDIGQIRQITERINAGKNVHQHLDLIAGLPFENLESFRKSFDDVYDMEPEQLQLGFLKVLKGSYMEETASDWGLSYSSKPPYEVLSTNWLSYGHILELKAVEDMVEVYYNSRQFINTLEALEGEYLSPYRMFLDLALHYESRGLDKVSHSRIARYEILCHFLEEHFPKEIERYRDLLTYDLYLRENVKSRPSFARDQSPFKARIRDFFAGEEASPLYLAGYKGYDSRQMSKMAHIEGMGDGSMVLFDYRERDPLTYNAKAYLLGGTGAGAANQGLNIRTYEGPQERT